MHHWGGVSREVLLLQAREVGGVSEKVARGAGRERTLSDKPPNRSDMTCKPCSGAWYNEQEKARGKEMEACGSGSVSRRPRKGKRCNARNDKKRRESARASTTVATREERGKR